MVPYNPPWDRRRLRPWPHPMFLDNWRDRRAARRLLHDYQAPQRIVMPVPARTPVSRPDDLRFGSLGNGNAGVHAASHSMHHGWIWIDITVADMSIIYEGNRSSDDVVLDYLAMLGSDEDELQSPVGSLSYVPTPNPAEPDRTIRVEYMSDILCPIARNLPICTLTSFIETAVHRAISAVRPPDVHPYPVDITVIINSPFGERIMPLAPADHAITFTVTDPPPPPNPPKPPQRPSQSWDERPALLDHKHAFKYLIEYELAYNDLKQCTFPLGQKDDPNFSLEHRSARFDPMSRLNILSRMLRNYFQVLLSGTSWLDDPIPSDGVLECVWTFMRQVVEDGDRRALKDLHLFLDPKF